MGNGVDPLYDLAIWALGLVGLLLSYRLYWRVRPEGTWHLMTVYGAPAAGVICGFFVLLEGAWLICIPAGLFVAAIAYFTSAWGWVRASYVGDIAGSLRHPMNVREDEAPSHEDEAPNQPEQPERTTGTDGA